MYGVCRRAAELRNTVYGGRRRVPGVVRRGAPSVSEPTLSVNRGERQGRKRLGWTARRARWTRRRSGGRSSQRSRDPTPWQQSPRLRLPLAPAWRAGCADCGDRLRARLPVDRVASHGPNSSGCCVSGSADKTVALRTPGISPPESKDSVRRRKEGGLGGIEILWISTSRRRGRLWCIAVPMVRQLDNSLVVIDR